VLQRQRLRCASIPLGRVNPGVSGLPDGGCAQRQLWRLSADLGGRSKQGSQESADAERTLSSRTNPVAGWCARPESPEKTSPALSFRDDERPHAIPPETGPDHRDALTSADRALSLPAVSYALMTKK
jgi:hypothetical protein